MVQIEKVGKSIPPYYNPIKSLIKEPILKMKYTNTHNLINVYDYTYTLPKSYSYHILTNTFTNLTTRETGRAECPGPGFVPAN